MYFKVVDKIHLCMAEIPGFPGFSLITFKNKSEILEKFFNQRI